MAIETKRRVCALVIGTVCLMGGRESARPQTASAAREVARDSGASMQRIADGVYAIIHRDAILSFPDGSTDWPHSNVGVIVGDDAVLVVDSDFFPSRAADDIALIRRTTTKPVRYLVNTHWHGDHTHGNATYLERFPGLTIVGSRQNARYIPVNQARYPRSTLAEGSAVRKELAALEERQRQGTDSTGRPLSLAARKLLDVVVRQLHTQLAEFASIRVAGPTQVFEKTLTLDLGHRRVQLVNEGHANSPSDVTAWLPAERVLFAGDIVVWPVPYTFDSYPTYWIDVLRRLEGLRAVTIVPGHGPVFSDYSYPGQVRELLSRAVTVADSLVRRGSLRPDVERAIDLEAFRPRFVRAGDVNAEAYWEAAIRHSLPERAYQCVVGSRC